MNALARALAGPMQEGLMEQQLTGHDCADCGRGIHLLDDCTLIQVIQPQKVDGGVVTHQIIDPNDSGGDFLFDPWFFCGQCWRNNYEQLSQYVEDSMVPDSWSDHLCTGCGSGIRNWEYTGQVDVGDFQVSRHAPFGTYGPIFVAETSRAELLCLHCLVMFNENIMELWNNLSQFDECISCIRARCWRRPNGSISSEGCDCPCHVHGGEHGWEEEEEEDD